ncbi:hypothetical protein C6P40_000839 [Pichia californica]|uniref:Peptidase S8/S53 domain-containing protein n=1 Tax=Pichia californica TaxID=460514 RepID=A0A9P6WM30_9ASCO|nr:hypothetical protein C6P42_004187 [[Candida] californica]KAG0688543.1 hypothetical protein C6P40_000839 [[Candida] californica]
MRLLSTLLFFFFLLTFTFAAPINKETERYIIQLKKPEDLDILMAQDDKVRSFAHLRNEIKKVYSIGKEFEGFIGEFSKEVIDRIRSNPLVEFLCHDFPIEALDVSAQYDAPSHLVRLSQEGPVEDDEDSTYYYSEEFQGKGVNVYVIDTGVSTKNPDFEGRAILGPNFSSDLRNIDYIGHGTHVAGIVGSKTYGVAKEVTIHSVKVLDRKGQGTLSAVIEGLEYAVNHHLDSGVPGIANLSLGAARSTILDAAIKAAYDAGLLVVTAAGNNNMNACRTSPAGSPYAITVGSINDKNDQIAHFSNWGNCVDIFASGVEVRSLSNKQDEFQILSGTSMSSPIVAGLAAIIAEQGYDAADIPSEIRNMAVWNAIPSSNLRMRAGTPNAIVNNAVDVSQYSVNMLSNFTLTF